MSAPRSSLPGLDSLQAELETVFRGPVLLLEREPNWYASTFPSEVVRCRLGTGEELQVLCKYASGRDHGSFGHRRGVAYEAAVYREVLQPLPVSSPAFYGASADRSKPAAGLFIEFLGQGAGVDEAPSPPAALRLAAQWVGTFHALNEARLANDPLPFLARYDRDYYLQWARRTSQLAGPWHRRFPWLVTLCGRMEDFASSLASMPSTIIHGEFAPSNVLIRDDRICPVDWESAAIGLGEIDLVSLIEGWPEEVAADCVRDYQQARWPAGTPNCFGRALDMAWLYWHFRWLGERRDWLTSKNAGTRLPHLREVGERLRLLPLDGMR